MELNPISEEAVTEAEYIHVEKVICLIDPEDLYNVTLTETNYILNISVSNNGVDFSEPKILTVYEGDCWECENMTCNQKVY